MKRNIHPGEILKLEFMEPLKLSAYQLAKDMDVPQTRISEIINARRGISADTAIRLSKRLKTTARFWMNLQSGFDLENEMAKQGIELTELADYQIPVVRKKGIK